MVKPIYLDYNATTPVDPRVMETMLPFFTEHFGNASSRTHAFGWYAADAVKKARAQTAALIGSEDQEIVFTSGATESINLAIKGVFENYKSKGKHIVTVQTEHKAVLDTCLALEMKGAEVTRLEVDREGRIDLDELAYAIRPDTILVSVMHANNETGLIHPVDKIAAIVKEKGSLLFCDATQSAGKLNIDVKGSGIGMLALSAHKFYGPKGVGALFVSRKNPRVVIQPLIDGGGHERGLRSGTLNVSGIVGLGKAAELAFSELWDNAERISKLRTKLEQFLMDLGQVFVNGAIRDRLPNTSNLSFTGIKADELIAKLPHIALATGSACTSAIAEPSHVLTAMGIDPVMAKSSVRFSLGKDTTEEEIDRAISQVSEAVNLLRKENL